jgi:hypothetical protein
MKQNVRLEQGNQIKAVFNVLWDKALQSSPDNNALAYRDMTRISEMMSAEVPAMIDIKTFPKQIETGLKLAVASVSPDKTKTKENLKHAINSAIGTGGMGIIVISLAQLINPGIWAIALTFFAGGVAGGPMAVFGVSAGLFLVGGALYRAFQNMTPSERATQAHSYVMRGIDAWIMEKPGEKELLLDKLKALNISQSKKRLSTQDSNESIEIDSQNIVEKRLIKKIKNSQWFKS